jgi:hypothetical protein
MWFDEHLPQRIAGPRILALNIGKIDCASLPRIDVDQRRMTRRMKDVRRMG